MNTPKPTFNSYISPREQAARLKAEATAKKQADKLYITSKDNPRYQSFLLLSKALQILSKHVDPVAVEYTKDYSKYQSELGKFMYHRRSKGVVEKGWTIGDTHLVKASRPHYDLTVEYPAKDVFVITESGRFGYASTVEERNAFDLGYSPAELNPEEVNGYINKSHRKIISGKYDLIINSPNRLRTAINQVLTNSGVRLTI